MNCRRYFHFLGSIFHGKPVCNGHTCSTHSTRLESISGFSLPHKTSREDIKINAKWVFYIGPDTVIAILCIFTLPAIVGHTVWPDHWPNMEAVYKKGRL